VSLTLKPYPEYKESALKSLGSIPAHWSEIRAKYIFCEVDDRSVTGAEELLSVSHITGVTPRSQKNVTMFLAESNVGHKRCRPKDLVINTMWAWMGALGVSGYSGLVSPSYDVYRPLNSKTEPQFLDALLRTSTYVGEYITRSTGINSSRLRLYPEKFLSLPIVLPPTDEQVHIGLFIRGFSFRLQKLIRAKRRAIDLLNEQRSATLIQVLKSYIAAPVIPLRYLGTKFGSGMTPRGGAQVYKVTGVPLLRSQNVHFDGLRLDDVAFISDEVHADMSGTQVQPGDVLLNITGASIGRLCVVPNELMQANVNQHVCIIRPKQRRISARFLAAVLSSPSFQEEIYLAQNGASREGLPVWKLKSIRIPCPSLDEQAAAISKVDKATRSINTAIATAGKEVDLLRQYRTRLITDVVTGKLDARNVQLQELEGAEEVETLTDVEDEELEDSEELVAVEESADAD
jgi:type I restriction enzyme S subunit